VVLDSVCIKKATAFLICKKELLNLESFSKKEEVRTNRVDARVLIDNGARKIQF